MHKQSILKKFKFKKQNFINSDHLSSKGFYLPSGIGLKNKDIYQICEIFKKIIKKFSK